MTKKPPFSAALTDELRLLCQLGKDAVFAALAGRYGFTIFNNGTPDRYAYRQGTIPLLGVAHADTVLNSDFFEFDGVSKVASPELDDRLGLWTLLHGLPSIGCDDYSILVTDFEEIGQSTAAAFDSPIDFNWIFQFDRRGTGVVNYEYADSGLFDSLLTSAFGKLHRGSFSDICSLTDLGVKGFNVGTAYYNEHSMGCWANLKELRKQMTNFHKFFNSFKGWMLPHTPPRRRQNNDWDYWTRDAFSVKKTTSKSTKSSLTPIPSSPRPAASITRMVAPAINRDAECCSCLQVFDTMDCTLLADGCYLCSDCIKFFQSDLRAEDIVG
jgi:hypothetical protein